MAKYGKAATKKVERAMHKRKRGTLKSGSLGEKGHEPETGDRNRAVASAPRRRKSPEEKVSQQGVSIPSASSYRFE